MTSISLNISGKISAESVEICTAVREVCLEQEIPYVIVGASARDMVLHYGYGAKIQRATSDLDFGIQVSDWAAFGLLKAELVSRGFRETKTEHRVISPSNIQVDIVPFGELEDGAANIRLPPKGDFVMNVLGFSEACETAELIRVQDDPEVDVPVATPPGVAILKIIAWADRDTDLRNKDARDLSYLLTTYDKVPAISTNLYEKTEVMERYDWDVELAGAYQLGVDSRSMAQEATAQAILSLLEDRHPKLDRDRLIGEMGGHSPDTFERAQELIEAYKAGFVS
ncbi:MAG: nucleotidyl transferase AbiEii/AbiGii toxin family protein [Halioglobus sp.]